MSGANPHFKSVQNNVAKKEYREQNGISSYQASKNAGTGNDVLAVNYKSGGSFQVENKPDGQTTYSIPGMGDILSVSSAPTPKAAPKPVPRTAAKPAPKNVNASTMFAQKKAKPAAVTPPPKKLKEKKAKSSCGCFGRRRSDSGDYFG